VLGRTFNAEGRPVLTAIHERLTAVPLSIPPPRTVVAAGMSKIAAIRAALKGGIINALITDEATAGAMLDP